MLLYAFKCWQNTSLSPCLKAFQNGKITHQVTKIIARSVEIDSKEYFLNAMKFFFLQMVKVADSILQ